jgi:hypothetical protein
MLIGAMPCITFDANLSHIRTLAEVSLFRVYLATGNYVRAEHAPSAEPCSGDPCLRSSQAPLGRRVRSWFDLAAPIASLRQGTTSVVVSRDISNTESIRLHSATTPAQRRARSGDPCLRSSQASLGRRVRSWFAFDLAAPIVALRQETTSVVP